VRSRQGHQLHVPGQGRDAGGVVGARISDPGDAGAVSSALIGIVVLVAIGVEHKIPADQIVGLAVAVVVEAVQVTGIVNPGAAVVVGGIAVGVGVLSQVVPEVGTQVGMAPSHPGVHHGQDHRLGSVFAFMNVPGRFCHEGHKV